MHDASFFDYVTPARAGIQSQRSPEGAQRIPGSRACKNRSPDFISFIRATRAFLIRPFKGRTEVGDVVTHRAFLILPFKGRTEVGHVVTHRAFLILPFKGRTEVGMGSYLRAANSDPSPSHPSP